MQGTVRLQLLMLLLGHGNNIIPVIQLFISCSYVVTSFTCIASENLLTGTDIQTSLSKLCCKPGVLQGLGS